MNENILNVHKIPSTIFFKSKENFKQSHVILAIYSIVKFLVALTLVILQNVLDPLPHSELNNFPYIAYLKPWMICSVIHSFFASIYYVRLLLYIDQNYLDIAEQLDHMILFELPEEMNEPQREEYGRQQIDIQNNEIILRMEMEGQLEDGRRISVLTSEIKKKIQEESCIAKYIGKTQFFTFQGLQIFGLFFYCINYNNISSLAQFPYYNYYRYYLFVTVFLGLYHYLEIYIMAILIATWRKRKERIRIESSLSESEYKVNQFTKGINKIILKGEDECSICMCTYEISNKIVQLQCSEKHHFHSECIKSWLEVNNKCPLCRNKVIDDTL
ncbi:hypothetical protein pb186bvf_020035 [Paramecium bursaria]